MTVWCVSYQITDFNVPFTPKHLFEIDNTLFNVTYEYAVRPIDIVAINWEKDTNNTLTLRIHHRVDFTHRKYIISNLTQWSHDDTILNRLIEMNDDFINVFFCHYGDEQCQVIIDENSFTWNSWNIFYNFYWDCLFGILIVSFIWWGFCKLGRKQCAKKEAEKAKKESEKQSLI